MEDLNRSQPGLPGCVVIREHLDLPVKTVADMLGKTRDFWRKVEAGDCNCTLATAEVVSAYLCCTVDELRRGVTPARLADIKVAFDARQLERSREAQRLAHQAEGGQVGSKAVGL